MLIFKKLNKVFILILFFFNSCTVLPGINKCKHSSIIDSSIKYTTRILTSLRSKKVKKPIIVNKTNT